MKRILIIEDEQNIRETLADLLNLIGYEVLEAANGKEGVAMALAESIDLILCDVNMPEIDGYQVLSELRKMDRLTLIPFIFLTAKSSMQELRTGMELGADDYLTKPFTRDSLMRAIKVAEEKKISIIHQLSSLQNQLNLEKLKLKDVDTINSHEIRRKLSLIQGLVPLIRSKDLSLEQGLEILETSGEEMDNAIHRLNGIVNGGKSHTKQKGKSIKQIESIWLVDDDPTQNLLTKMLLRKVNADWVIMDFNNPQTALEEIPLNPPDLVFLDVNMPEIDGFDFLERISVMNLELRVIMLSSSLSPCDIGKSLGYPFVANYLVKPLKKEMVIEIFEL